MVDQVRFHGAPDTGFRRKAHWPLPVILEGEVTSVRVAPTCSPAPTHPGLSIQFPSTLYSPTPVTTVGLMAAVCWAGDWSGDAGRRGL